MQYYTVRCAKYRYAMMISIESTEFENSKQFTSRHWRFKNAANKSECYHEIIMKNIHYGYGHA